MYTSLGDYSHEPSYKVCAGTFFVWMNVYKLDALLRQIASGVPVKGSGDFADEWETGVLTADTRNAAGHLCQGYLQLSGG